MLKWHFAGHRLPEGVELLRDEVTLGLLDEGPLLREFLADLDPEDLLVLLDGALVVDQYKDPPAHLPADEIHPDGAFELVNLALEALQRFVNQANDAMRFFRGYRWDLDEELFLGHVRSLPVREGYTLPVPGALSNRPHNSTGTSRRVGV